MALREERQMINQKKFYGETVGHKVASLTVDDDKLIIKLDNGHALTATSLYPDADVAWFCSACSRLWYPERTVASVKIEKSKDISGCADHIALLDAKGESIAAIDELYSTPECRKAFVYEVKKEKENE
jgi:hypothetical protein